MFSLQVFGWRKHWRFFSAFKTFSSYGGGGMMQNGEINSRHDLKQHNILFLSRSAFRTFYKVIFFFFVFFSLIIVNSKMFRGVNKTNRTKMSQVFLYHYIFYQRLINFFSSRKLFNLFSDTSLLKVIKVIFLTQKTFLAKMFLVFFYLERWDLVGWTDLPSSQTRVS